MSALEWICYRCDLTFKKESHALIHKDLTNHHSNEIKAPVSFSNIHNH